MKPNSPSRTMRTTAAIALMLAAPGVAARPQPNWESVASTVGHRADAGELSVMSYNIEGLPPPARFGRSDALVRIGDRLAAERKTQTEPNVVLLQEAFNATAGRLAQRAGYRYAASGPPAGAANSELPPPGAAPFVAAASHFKGENDGKWADSGLRILSDYPIVKVRREAFPAWACAGYDCLANKGVLIAWIAVPGAREPIAFIDTHLNSRAASGVAKSRADQAYGYQVMALRDFVARNVAPGRPAFLGGDFNSGKARARWADLRGGVLTGGRNSLFDALAKYGAISRGDRPNAQALLLRGKDWLFYRGAGQERFSLAAFTVPFGREQDGTMMSDHMGYEVRYRIEPVKRT